MYLSKKPVQKERPQWGSQWEFLMSCIATSVGLGNIWRFPFVCYENGGGAFLIPYLVVLIFIGKPIYYLETSLGQFSSNNCVKVWDVVPALRGTGFVQTLSAVYVLSYYMSIVGLCIYYLVMSVQSTLPWSVCKAMWSNCVPSGQYSPDPSSGKSSAEFYFMQVVLQGKTQIHDGIGTPLWHLALCLFLGWISVFLINVRGIKTSGKVSYFLALFPYVILVILLIRSVTLPGASKGILFFITPVWSRIMELKVWYAAVTQAFFSLSICSGALIVFSSYNRFGQDVYRDSLIVSTLDTFTSLISGFTIFGMLGNLAHQLGYDDVQNVIGTGGSSLVFISYPDAIAQSPFFPQLFAFLFFFMMLVLGVGSGVALHSTMNTILLDYFPNVPTVTMSGLTCFIGFFLGLIYTTPGGQHMLQLVDFYGGTFMRLFAAITETMGIFWIYGLENMCLDIEFMLHKKTCFYWRICWSIITPLLMFSVFVYSLVTKQIPKFGDTYIYPESAFIAGSTLQYSGVALIPIVMIITFYKFWTHRYVQTIKQSFKPLPTYGPSIPAKREEWLKFITQAREDRENMRRNRLHHLIMILSGAYRWGK
ncbi:unnamed protein product [Arctia plantaginis]|uniref:Transporter n=1 Tax=Arctia plantaginis TaxID=874455 RepID=A0A8S0YWM9_ARCPL|nr:unnamed protein product [Arctia plantaginis]